MHDGENVGKRSAETVKTMQALTPWSPSCGRCRYSTPLYAQRQQRSYRTHSSYILMLCQSSRTSHIRALNSWQVCFRLHLFSYFPFFICSVSLHQEILISLLGLPPWSNHAILRSTISFLFYFLSPLSIIENLNSEKKLPDAINPHSSCINRFFWGSHDRHPTSCIYTPASLSGYSFIPLCFYCRFASFLSVLSSSVCVASLLVHCFKL